MVRLSEVEKSRITEVLDSAYSRQHGFTIKYDDENNPVATITFSASPECQFAISSADNDGFTTSECPGIHSDAVETFQRSNFDLCG
jgi:hypothetical protein